MTRKHEKDSFDICSRHNLLKEYFPYASVLTSMGFVSAGNKHSIPDQIAGKVLVAYHV